SGINILNRAFKSSAATCFVQLKPWEERHRSVNEITGQLMAKFGGSSKGALFAASPPPIPGLGTTGGFTLEIQEQQSGDIKAFEGIVGKFLMAANQRPEIAMAYTLFNTKTPNYKVEVDREQARKMG